MSLKDTISTKMTESMKAGDQFSLGILRMVKTALQNAEIAKSDHQLSDADEIQIMQKEIKKRRDSAQMYRDGARAELAEKEDKEATYLEQFVPEQASDDEIMAELKQAIATTSASSPADMGKVMAAAMPNLKGKADGSRISQLLRTLLQ